MSQIHLQTAPVNLCQVHKAKTTKAGQQSRAGVGYSTTETAPSQLSEEMRLACALCSNIKNLMFYPEIPQLQTERGVISVGVDLLAAGGVTMSEQRHDPDRPIDAPASAMDVC